MIYRILFYAFLLLSQMACEQSDTYVDEEERTAYSASEQDQEEIVVESLELFPSTINLILGESLKLSVFANMSDATRKEIFTVDSIKFSDNNIAKIYKESMKLEASSIGVTEITVSYGGQSASKNIEVTGAVFKNIVMDLPGGEMLAGKSFCAKIKATLSNFTMVDITNSVVWTIGDEELLNLIPDQDKHGCFKMLKAGEVSLKAEYQELVTEKQVKIDAPKLEYIIPAENVIKLPVGLTSQVGVNGLYTDDSSADISLVSTWKSSNPEIAEVKIENDSIVVEAKTQGFAKLLITNGTIQGEMTVVVSSEVLESIAISNNEGTVPKGVSTKFIATGNFSDGSTQDLTSLVTWSVEDPSIISISNAEIDKGTANGVAPGTTNVLATLNDITGEFEYTISSAVLTSVEVLPTGIQIPEGLTQNFTATGYYSDGTSVDITEDANWSSTNPTGVSVDNDISEKGIATGVNEGIYEIRASLGSFVGKVNIDILDAQLISISFTEENPTTKQGLSIQMTALGLYTDGVNRGITSKVFWNIDYSGFNHSKVAWVSNSPIENGKIYSFAEGTALVKASLDGISHSAELIITEKEIKFVRITPDNPIIDLGVNQQFYATATYTDGSTLDVTETGGDFTSTWSHNTGAAISLNDGGIQGFMVPITEASTTITLQVNTPWGNFVDNNLMTVRTPCPTGLRYDNFCWYLSGAGESCSDICSLNDGYHNATEFFASATGRSNYCKLILDQFGFTSNSINSEATNVDNFGLGCSLLINGPPTPVKFHYITPAALDLDAHVDHRRVCACKG